MQAPQRGSRTVGSGLLDEIVPVHALPGQWDIEVSWLNRARISRNAIDQFARMVGWLSAAHHADLLE
jgi:hypothetical protein